MATIKSLRIMMYVDHNQLGKGLQKVKRDVGRAAADMAKTLAAAFASRAVGSAFVAGLKEAIAYEQFTVDLAVLGGDGAGLFKELRKEALKSPFPIEDWMMGGKRLLGAEVPMERVVKILKMLGEMSAGTGSSIRELGLVFTQIWAKGRLQGEEMLQFMERNVSLNKALQKVLKVNKEELQKLQEAGKITPENVIQAMEEMTRAGGLFGGMMEAKMQTFGGAVTRLSNVWRDLTATFGFMIMPFANKLLDVITRMVADGYLLLGLMTPFAALLDIAVIAAKILLEVFHTIDMLTGGLLGATIGIVISWGLIAGFVFLAQKGVMWMTGGLGVSAFFAAMIEKSMARMSIIAIILSGTIGYWLIALIAFSVVLAAIFKMMGMDILGGQASKFDKIKKDLEETFGKSPGGQMQSPSGALFGSTKQIQLVGNARSQDIQQRQLEELEMIRKQGDRGSYNSQEDAERAKRSFFVSANKKSDNDLPSFMVPRI